MVEAWLRGPIAGQQAVLMPAAFALVQAREEIEAATAGLSDAELWARPGDAASVGYHLRHLAGSTDRLLTYASGGTLSEEQLRVLTAEKAPPAPGENAAVLTERAAAAIDRALTTLRAADPAQLQDVRTIGRARLPVTLLGVLGHVAEHATRHAGQIVTTAKIVRALHP